MKKRITAIMLCLIFVAGCVKGIDPITGEQTFAVDPNVVGGIEPLVETGLTIAGILGGLFPVILPFVTLAGGIYGTWLKIRPQVTKAQNRATLMHTGVTSLVVAIEELKKISPESWEKLKEEIKVGPEIENIIRAIRGLPPIE